ncbi:MAG: ATP-dependent metallopeptidase FtsH/Yme1/Tma family protein, partial [Victivallaceae bacterium]|nr:ATP-dependent metallopeptidase FtsH/Yme1/Tma family protein [Victivallaceae bacterium]
MKDSKDRKNIQPQEPKSRPSGTRSAFVWLGVLAVIGALLIFKGGDSSETIELAQSAFEQRLRTGDVATVVLSHDSDNVYAVEGKIKADEGSAGRSVSYKTRVVLTQSLEKALDSSKADVSVENNHS